MTSKVGCDVVIVADEKGRAEIEAATKLRNMIGEWGKYSAVLWSVKQYKDNEQNISSEQLLVFVGLNEISARNVASIHWNCDELGMRYGWCGNVGMVQVVPQTFGSLDWMKLKELCTYDGFRAYNEIREYNEVLADPTTAVDAEMTDIIKAAIAIHTPTAAFDADMVDAGIMDQIAEIEYLYLAPTFRAAMMFPIIPPPNPNDIAGGKLFFRKSKIRAKVLEVQYAYLVCKLVAELKEYHR